MKRPNTYEEAVEIKFPQISVTDTPFDELLTAVILELALMSEERGRDFWNKYQAGKVDMGYFDL